MMEVCLNANGAATSSAQYSEACLNHNNNNNNNNTISANNNNIGNVKNGEEVKPAVRPKRDFRFKVIEVQNGPKWFVWPSRNRGSSEEVDENHNKGAGAADVSATVSQNGYGALRRSVLRQSKRKTDQEAITSRTASEPASARRLSAKKEKAVTEPICQVSSMFKIISIDKKWESFDVTDEEDDDDDAKTIVVGSLNDVGERRWTTSI